MINEPVEGKQIKYLLEFILPRETKLCHPGACSMILLVKALQTEVKPLLAPCELGLSHFSSREPPFAGRAALSSAVGGVSAWAIGGAKPRIQEENPARGCCWATGVKRVTGVLRPRLRGCFYRLGCGGGSRFSLGSPENKGRHAFRFEIKKTKKQLFTVKAPNPTNQPKIHPPNK